MFPGLVLMASVAVVPPVLLKDARATLTMPSYTAEERVALVEQAQLMLDQLYVHRERKIELNGPMVDPTPRLALLRETAAELTDQTLHRSLRRVFADQRDLHTTYTLPWPLRCYRSFLPIGLSEVQDQGGQPVLAVEAIAAAALDVAPEARLVHVGDVLLTYDGMPAYDALDVARREASGANDAASRFRAMQYLTGRGHARHFVPPTDTLALTLRDRLGRVYAVEMPWVVTGDDACLRPTEDEGGTARAKGEAFRLAVDDDQIFYEQTFHPHDGVAKRLKDLRDVPALPTNDDILSYATFDNELGTWAYLRLKSMVPSTSINGVAAEVRRLLTGPLAATDGLVIDVRGNGGGMIVLGDVLAQLFGPAEIASMRFRLKASRGNLFYVTHAPWLVGTPWEQGVVDAIASGRPFAADLPITLDRASNSGGTAYFKPVAVLTDARCYSTCDLFTAQMQDHGHALVWSAGERTGGGGANNVGHNDFLEELVAAGSDPGPFAALPGGQDMGIAWRAMIRTGLHAGELIEDVGVEADRHVTRTLADLFTQDAGVLRQITAELATRSASMQARVDAGSLAPIDVAPAEAGEVSLRVAGTDTISYRLDAGEDPTTLAVTPSRDARRVALPLSTVHPVGAVATVTAVGRRDIRNVWRIARTLRWVPEPTPLAAEGAAWNFDDGTTGGLTPFRLGEGRGWHVEDGKLVVGGATPYEDHEVAQASLFLQLPEAPSMALAFEADIATELDYDFFGVSAICDGVQSELLPQMSGRVPAQGYSVSLAAFAGKAVELRFEMTSDGGVIDAGVKLDAVALNPDGHASGEREIDAQGPDDAFDVGQLERGEAFGSAAPRP